MKNALRLILRLFVLTVWLAAGSALIAETVAGKGFDFKTWETTASRAEGIIKDAQASSPALETLRGTLADFRSKALAVQDDNKARIETLQSQLDALGPAPKKGETEAPEVASRRKALTDQLAKAKAPVLAAQEAYKRADGMIGEIDRIIRERVTSELFTLGKSPLNPGLWPESISILLRFSGDIQGEVSEALSSDAQWVMTRRSLPASLSLIVLALVLLTRARVWALRLLGLVPEARHRAHNEARALLLSTMRLIVPMLGVWALIGGLRATGLVGLRGDVVLSALPSMALAIFGGNWLGRTLFSKSDNTPMFFWFSEEEGRTGTRLAAAMGFALALHYGLEGIAASADFPLDAHIVLSFPIVLLAGILLVRTGILLEPERSASGAGVSENPLQSRIFRLLTRTLIVLGVLGPLLAAVGYFTASISFIFPAIETLALLGTMLVLYRLVINLTEELLLSSGQVTGEGERPVTLLPVAIGFFLILLSLPLLALIWGARVSDLQEVWRVVNDGFQIGNRRISITDFLMFAVVFAIGYTATRLVQSALRTTVLPRMRLDAGGRNAILTGTGYVGIFLAAVAAITSAGLDLSSLAIVAGALSVGIGFGLQAIVSNFVSGIILLVERPIKEGDWIEVGANSGYVRKISVRSTEIETFDRATVIVPNADFISGTVTNWTHSNMNGRVKVPVGVAYDSDPEKVRQILLEIAEGHDLVDHRTHPSVVFLGFGADSLNFEIRAILKDVNYVLSVRSDMNFEIFRRFKEAGINIPFAQRDINLRDMGELGDILRRMGGEDVSPTLAAKRPSATPPTAATERPLAQKDARPQSEDSDDDDGTGDVEGIDS